MARKPAFFKVLHSDFSDELKLPPKFSKELKRNVLDKNKSCKDFRLEISEGRIWDVEVAESEGKCLYFRKGWKEFVKDNSLGYGNFLVFEYQGNFKFNIDIFGRKCSRIGVSEIAWKESEEKTLSCHRNSKPSDEAQQKETNDDMKKRKKCGESQTQEAVTKQQIKLKKFKSNYPNFIVTMRATYVQTAYLNVPKNFMKMSGLTLSPQGQGQKVKLEVSDKSKTWYMKMSDFASYARLYSGWKIFAKDNSLKEDDVCLFELIDTNDITFRVTISKNTT